MTIGGRHQVEGIAARSLEWDEIPDPGDTGTFDTTRSGICRVTTAGAETRTLPDPVYFGQQLWLVMEADGGDCTITASSPVNQTGHTTITLSAVGGSILLLGKYNATDGWEWQEVFEDTGSATS